MYAPLRGPKKNVRAPGRKNRSWHADVYVHRGPPLGRSERSGNYSLVTGGGAMRSTLNADRNQCDGWY
jgi:hypothetical protein